MAKLGQIVVTEQESLQELVLGETFRQVSDCLFVKLAALHFQSCQGFVNGQEVLKHLELLRIACL